jgi:hypothetical protein
MLAQVVLGTSTFEQKYLDSSQHHDNTWLSGRMYTVRTVPDSQNEQVNIMATLGHHEECTLCLQPPASQPVSEHVNIRAVVCH